MKYFIILMSRRFLSKHYTCGIVGPFLIISLVYSQNLPEQNNCGQWRVFPIPAHNIRWQPTQQIITGRRTTIPLDIRMSRCFLNWIALNGTSSSSEGALYQKIWIKQHLIIFINIEYLSVSKRYATELANILNGLLFINIPGKNKVKLPLNPPFKRFGPASELLVLEKGLEKFEVTKLTLAAVNEREKEITDEFRVTILCGTVKLLHQLCECWSELPSIKAIMEPTTKLLDALNLEKYPTCAKEAVDGLRYVIASLPKQRPALTKEAKKPKSLKMFEPAFEKITDGMKKHYANKDFQEKQKLLHKLKRERKGARREIQRDTAFLARQQLMETLKSDAERKRKVNQIMGALQTQESEHKKLKLKKY